MFCVEGRQPVMQVWFAHRALLCYASNSGCFLCLRVHLAKGSLLLCFVVGRCVLFFVDGASRMSLSYGLLLWLLFGNTNKFVAAGAKVSLG